MRKILIFVAALSLSAVCAQAELFVVKMTLRVKAVDPSTGNLSNVVLTAANVVASCGEDPANATLVLDSDDPGTMYVADNETGDDIGCIFADDTVSDRTCAISSIGTKSYCQAFFVIGDDDGSASAIGSIEKRIDSATGDTLRYNWTAKIQGTLNAAFFGLPAPSQSQANLPFEGNFSSPKRFVLTGAPNCPTPSATTSAASNISTNSATLNGTANPNGFTASAHFEYGLTPALSDPISTAPQDIGHGTADTAVTANLNPLVAGQTYYYRLVVAGGCGTTSSSITSFSTSSP